MPNYLIIIIAVILTLLLTSLSRASDSYERPRRHTYIRRDYPKGKRLVYEDETKKVYEQYITVLGSPEPKVKVTVKEKK